MITPSQLRSAARFGTPIRKETLLELADALDAARRCNSQPVQHLMGKWECVAQTEDTKTFMRSCHWCGEQQFTGPLKRQHPYRRRLEVGWNDN